MALLLWLPLIDDTNNYGVHDFGQFSRNQLYTNNLGKIGKCYVGHCIWHTNEEVLGNEWTITMWVKSSTWGASNDILFCKNSNAATGCQIYLSVINGKIFNIGINGTNYGTLLVNYTFSTDIWYHLAAKFDGSTVCLYINGTMVGSKVATSSQQTGAYNIGLSCRSGNNSGTAQAGYYQYKYYNDVRLYDHVLTDQEIKKISQGLMIHYTLSGPTPEHVFDENRNLLPYTTDQSNLVGAFPEERTYTFTGWQVHSRHLALDTINFNEHVGEYLTFSCWMSNDVQTAGVGTGIMIHIQYEDGTYTQVRGGKNGTRNSWLAEGESGYVWLTHQIPDPATRSNPTTISYILADIRHSSTDGSSTCRMKLAKVEFGQTPTPWTLYPYEETENHMIGGNPTIFNSPGDASLPDLKLRLDHTQDYNGYDYAWIGGTDKNLFKFSNVNKTDTKNGCTCTYDAVTDIIKVTGTSTSSSNYGVLSITSTNYRLPTFTAGETYYLSIIPETGTVDTRVYFQINYSKTSGGNASLTSGTASRAFTIPSDFSSVYYIFVGIAGSANNTTLNYSFRVQIEAGSSGTSFTPYSNICPIHGVNSADLIYTSKNIWDNDRFLEEVDIQKNLQGWYYGTSSQWYNAYRSDNDKNGLFHKDNLNLPQITISFDYYTSDATDVAQSKFIIYVEYTDGTSVNLIDCLGTPTVTHKVGTTAAGKFVSKLSVRYYNSSTVYIKNFQIEFGDTATDYQPCEHEYRIHKNMVDSNTVLAGYKIADNTFRTTMTTFFYRGRFYVDDSCVGKKLTFSANIDLTNSNSELNYARVYYVDENGSAFNGNNITNGTSGISYRTATITGKGGYFSFTYGSGSAREATISNIQLEEGATPTEFQPYNSFAVSQKNLLHDYTYLNAVYLDTSSTKKITSLSSTSPDRTICIPCQPSTTYTFSMMSPTYVRIGSFVNYPALNAAASVYVAQNNTAYRQKLSITTGANDHYLVIQLFIDANVTNGMNIYKALRGAQLEVGSSVTEFQQGALDAIYGGDLDLVNGTVKINKKSIYISWFYGLYATGTGYIGAYINATDMVSNSRTNGWCDSLRAINTPSNATKLGITYGASNTCVYCVFPISLVGGDTLADINNYIMSNPIQVVYNLAEPITYNLTTTSFRTLSGKNVIYSPQANYIVITDPRQNLLGLSDNIEYDISGYKRNAIKSNITYESYSPKYSASSVFNGSNSYIKCDTNNWMVNYSDEMTYNLWVYATAWTASQRMVSCTESGGFNIEVGASGYYRFPINCFTNEEHSTAAYIYNNNALKISDLSPGWHMITYVYTNTLKTVYLDGQVYGTPYNSQTYGIKYNSSARLFLGCEALSANPSSPYFTGRMSDFRMWSTALTADDIAELYQSSRVGVTG